MNGKKAKVLRSAATDSNGKLNEQRYKDMKRVYRTIILMESQKPKLIEPRVRKSTQMGVYLRKVCHMIVVKPLRALRSKMLSSNVLPDGKHFALTEDQNWTLAYLTGAPKHRLDALAA